jgi:hypothetical protein
MQIEVEGAGTKGQLARETYHFSPEALNLDVLLVGGRKVAEIRHGCN